MTSIRITVTAVCLAFLPGLAPGQLQLLPDEATQTVFGGGERRIRIVLHNPADKTTAVSVRSRIFQATSATAVRVDSASWKDLQMLPGQTIIESAMRRFPSVAAETRFFVQWLEDTNRVLGRTEVLVYPTNLLAQLKPLAGEVAMGVWDSGNQLKPLLKAANLEFADLEETGIESFSGKLAIIGPYIPKGQPREGLTNQIRALAKRGTGVVWIQPPSERHDKLQPSFYAVPEGEGAVVVVQSALASSLGESPQAQLNLIQFCQLALRPEPNHLPFLSPQP